LFEIFVVDALIPSRMVGRLQDRSPRRSRSARRHRAEQERRGSYEATTVGMTPDATARGCFATVRGPRTRNWRLEPVLSNAVRFSNDPPVDESAARRSIAGRTQGAPLRRDGLLVRGSRLHAVLDRPFSRSSARLRSLLLAADPGPWFL